MQSATTSGCTICWHNQTVSAKMQQVRALSQHARPSSLQNCSLRSSRPCMNACVRSMQSEKVLLATTLERREPKISFVCSAHPRHKSRQASSSFPVLHSRAPFSCLLRAPMNRCVFSLFHNLLLICPSCLHQPRSKNSQVENSHPRASQIKPWPQPMGPSG